MSKGKVTAEERIEAARACLDGRMSMKEAGRRLGVNSATVEIWVTRYEANGPSAFMWSGKRTAYPKELKKAAVEEYLSGGSSLRQLVGKYGLRDTHTLRKWMQRNLGILTPLEKHEQFYRAA